MSHPRPLVLIVEDSITLAEMYAHQLAAERVRVRRASSLVEAREMVAAEMPAAIVLDLHFPDGNGIDFLNELRAEGCDATIVVMTAHGSINVAVEAMQAGADDFLVKPFAPERLLTTLRIGIEKRRLERLVKTISPSAGGDRFEGFIGADLSMQALYRMIEQAARSKATVFITGESGTGKELCAEAIHKRSDRRAAPFIALNCAAIPKDLIESEIFGHLKGAFTGATADREGAATRADGGTLFLDEICEMDLALQTKLLRFLQTGTIQRVGGDKVIKVDARIICATNRDPHAEVEAGRFREDLYYRLHVVPLTLPPLRERGEDVLRVARQFLADFSREEGRRFSGFKPEAEALMLRYAWPGNIRELQNVVRRITVLHDGENVTPEMLPPELQHEAPSGAGAGPVASRPTLAARGDGRAAVRPLDEVEREAIEAAVAACGGNMTEAAHLLGVSVKTIYRKRQAWAADTVRAAG
jgi:DNA-binding NtrC family response regulator